MKLILRLVLSLFVAVGLVALLMWWGGTDPQAILATLASLEGGVYWRALGVHLLIYPLRSLRSQALLAPGIRPPFARLLPVTASHILASNLLPAKVGEATLVLYLRRACGVPAAEGLACLLVSRLLDLATVIGGLSAVCLVLGLAGAFPGLEWLVPLGIVLSMATLAVVALSVHSDRAVALASTVLHAVRLDRAAPGKRILEFAGRVELALRGTRSRGLLRGALLSIPIWLLVFSFYAILARGLGLDIGFATAAFGSGLASLANLLPINGIAGFGPMDMGWVVGFCALGVARDTAIAVGLAAHVVFIFNLALFGLLGHVAMDLLGPAPAPGPSPAPDERPPDAAH